MVTIMIKLIFFGNLLLFLINSDVLGQEHNQRKWGISIGGGLSFPVGVYSKKNPEESAILDNTVSFTRIVGFSKEISGFAATGFSYNAEIKYLISSRIKLFVIGGVFTNPVKTNGMANYVTETTDYPINLNESDYRNFYIMPGISYLFSNKNFDFEIKLDAGYSTTDFPYYEFVFTSLNPPAIFAHDGPQSDLHAFMVGGGMSATYHFGKRIETGFQALYQQANYAYHMSNRAIPGGSQVSEIDDILKVRAINAAVVLSYSF